MKNAIDFTQFRKGSKPNGRPIDYCPRCGRRGEKTVYRDGDIRFTHIAHVAMNSFLVIDELCWVSK